MFIAPKQQTISFFDSVNASSNKTLLSKNITTPFKIKRIRASFPAGVNRLMLLRFYIVGTTDAPTTQAPTGTDILQSVGQVNYITGDNNFIDFEHELVSPEGNRRVAVYAENTDTFAHTIECQVTIEFIDPRELESEKS